LVPIRRERLDATLSRNEPVDTDAYARCAGHLRWLFETARR
jgi:hypothetical protein